MQIIKSPLSLLTGKRIAVMQNALIAKHYEEVRNVYTQLRGWRHDYHNHIQTMKAYLSLNRLEELDAYLDKLDSNLTAVDTITKTGNITLDAILNSKLTLAAAGKINVNVRAIAPASLSMNEIDMCILVGNLLDNAIEACTKVEDATDRFIRVYIGMLKEQFYISITNSTCHNAGKHSGRYRTSKQGMHGFGLQRIDRIVDKYGGYVNRQSEAGVFATEIMLPV